MEELQKNHLRNYARKELSWAETYLTEQIMPDAATEQPIFFSYLFARLYQYVGNYLKAVHLAGEIEEFLQDAPESACPYSLVPIKYPLDFTEQINTSATQHTLDPFLVAGIIRQESTFDPYATSPSYARGLMQIIPATSRRLAKQLNVKDYRTVSLYEPDVNIAVGCAYLADLLQRFNGNLPRTIAAYNAGPNTTDKWWNEENNMAAGITEQEEIIENITYKATRSYVKHVLRNQALYRQFYEKAFSP